jgi:hypothetical protein
MGHTRIANKILVGKPQQKRLRGRPKHWWEDNIRIDIRDIWEIVEWVHLVEDGNQWLALMSTVMSLLVPYKVVSVLILLIGSFSRRTLLYGDSFLKQTPLLSYTHAIQWNILVVQDMFARQFGMFTVLKKAVGNIVLLRLVDFHLSC